MVGVPTLRRTRVWGAPSRNATAGFSPSANPVDGRSYDNGRMLLGTQALPL